LVVDDQNMKTASRLWMLACLAGLLLAACQPAVIPTFVPTLDPNCTEAGQIVHDSVPSSENSSLTIALQVYLPPCYDSQPERAYPVLYLLHGHTHSEATWFEAGMGQVAEAHIRSGDVPPFIIVAPHLVEDDPQANFIVKDVIPYIDSHYRTLSDRQYRAIAGGSLGAKFSARAALQNPDLFASVACFGGAARSSEKKLLAGWINNISEHQRPRILIDIGQQDPFLYEGQILTDLLDEANYPYQFNSEEGGHSYAYWIGNFDEFALAWIAEDWTSFGGIQWSR
jgi:enterochelin esterase-like enzyme